VPRPAMAGGGMGLDEFAARHAAAAEPRVPWL